jgi:hypothetical protein
MFCWGFVQGWEFVGFTLDIIYRTLGLGFQIMDIIIKLGLGKSVATTHREEIWSLECAQQLKKKKTLDVCYLCFGLWNR